MKNLYGVVAVFVCSTFGASADHAPQGPGLCRPNELFLNCGGCQRTCERPDPACAAVCHIGCYCPGDMVRGKDGKCIPLEECPKDVKGNKSEYKAAGNKSKYEVAGYTAMLCAENEEYSFCEPCGNRTCDNPNPVCPAQCARGCFCKEGMVRDRDGTCIKLGQCDRNSNYVKRDTHECGENQEFKGCEKCEKSCSNGDNLCQDECSQGCFCSEGFYRHPSGECVKIDDCPTEDCEDPNAEFVCRFPCEEFCSKKACAIRASRCSIGCYCKAGYVKEDSNGKCVKRDKCTTEGGS